MTWRAIILGLLLGLSISALTFFNDWVMVQTPLIGNLFPISVFGVAVVLVLGVNPLLRWLGLGERMLDLKEVAVIAAIGLAACGWPGSGYFRTFFPVLAMPTHWIKTKPAWQSANVFSYVPGGLAYLGEGHIRRWPEFCKLLAGEEGREDTPGGRLMGMLDEESRRIVREGARIGRVDPQQRQKLVRGINEVIDSAKFYDPRAFAGVKLSAELQEMVREWEEGRLDPEAAGLDEVSRDRRADRVHTFNRGLLVAAFPEYVLPAPKGEGALFLGGRPDKEALDTLLQGVRMSVWDLPWRAWWPSIKVWGALGLLMGMAGLCLALVTHPQWARRELLAYPVARFIQEVAERERGQILPTVCRSKLFWIGLGAMVGLHFINGMKAWFPGFIFSIPMKFDFTPMWGLLPLTGRVSNTAYYLWRPFLYPTVVAFSFFLTTDVSLSLGISLMAWAVFAIILYVNGVTMTGVWPDAGVQHLVLFGAFLGVTLIVLYVGRRHYWDVTKAAIGLGRSAETPGYCVWAARVLGLCVVGGVWVLRSLGLDLVLAVPTVLLFLVIFLVIARVSAESGVIFIQTGWFPVGVLTALFGIEAIGPTAYIIMALASFMIVADTREVIQPYLVNALEIVDRSGAAEVRRVWRPMAVMIVVGFVVALVATMYWQYNTGLSIKDGWGRNNMPVPSFDRLALHISNLSASGMLEQSMAIRGLERIRMMSPDRMDLFWIGLGLMFVLVTAAARLRLPWWPIHPVLFVFWGGYPCNCFAYSFLLGWMIKASVVKLLGAKGYHLIKPLMVGVIAGELLAGLGWMVVGAVYYLVTGLAPAQYAIFPL